MLILALDTALETCSAALVRGGGVLTARSEPMERGHQERLAPMAAEVCARGRHRLRRGRSHRRHRGPGSFTGLRVGLAFAKGLHLAPGRPLVGVGTLQALAQRGRRGRPPA